ncbi:MAG: S8 family serine peptidase [Phycisphaerales bacterium]
MTRRTLAAQITLVLGSTLGLHSPVCAQDQEITGHAILRLENGFTIEEVVATYGAEVLDVLDGGSRPHYLIQLPAALPDVQFLMQAAEDARIKDAEIDVTAAVPDPGTQSFFIPSASIRFTNQPSRGRAELNYGAGASAVSGALPGTLVAVIDTGIDTTHPLLAGRIAPNGVSLLFGDPSIEDAGDGADNDNDGDVDELVGHGTMVASAVLYADPDAVILPIRAVDSDGRSTAFRVAKGINEAVLRGARVINVSLGSTISTGVIDSAIEDATAAGVVVIASVGNDGANLERFPAASVGAIAVAGTGANDVHAPFTTFGSYVTISAPAVGFVGAFPGGLWAESSGTSFASPLVAGVASRILSANPALLPDQVRLVITTSADPIDPSNPGFEGLLGAGRVNARAALSQVGILPPYLEGDLDLDNRIDVNDLNRVLSVWHSADPIGDADYSGFVDIDDLNEILSMWGLP